MTRKRADAVVSRFTHCGDCRGRMYELRWGPMLTADRWASLGCAMDTILCEGCIAARVRKVHGRALAFDDLTWCPFNSRYLEALAPPDLLAWGIGRRDRGPEFVDWLRETEVTGDIESSPVLEDGYREQAHLQKLRGGDDEIGTLWKS